MKIERRGRDGKPARPGGEQVFEGLGVAPGIAIGTAHFIESGVAQVPEYRLAAGEAAAEQARCAAAVAQAQEQHLKPTTTSQNLPAYVAADVDFLFAAHQPTGTGRREHGVG